MSRRSSLRPAEAARRYSTPLPATANSARYPGKPIRPLVLAVHLAIVGAIFATAGWTPNAHAQATEQVRRYDIPAGPLTAALNRFAEEAGVFLSAPAELTQGKTTSGLSGNFTVEKGFAEIMREQPLQAVRQANGNYALRPGPTQTTKHPEATLPTVKVVAPQEDPYGPVDGYVAKRSATATKTDTPIIETPQSISVVGAEEFRTRKAENIMDALGYTAGVARREGADLTSEFFVIRGFRADAGIGSIYRDGTKYTVNGFDGQQELYGLERIEVLKGAASVLYGTTAPGGIINTVSKRPTAEALREINVEYGSFNRKQISTDFGGALTEDGTWSYRLTALKRESDSFIDHVPDDRTYIAPALKWQPNRATSLTLLGQYQHDRTAYVAGLPGEGTVLRNPNGKIPRNRFVGEPDFDKFDNQLYSIGYLFEHEFNERLKLRNSLRFFETDTKNNYTEIWQLQPDLRTTLFRTGVKRDAASKATVADTSLQYEWSSGSVKHTSLIGFDFTRQKQELEQYILDAAPLDLYNPTYGNPLTPPAPSNFYSPISESKAIGLYAQNQMKIADKWVVLLGGRKDWVTYDEKNFHTGAVAADDEKSDAFTGRAGLVYLAANGLAPYVSYSQSFEPQTGVDRNQSRFKPTEGEQWEIGMRYQPAGSDTLISAAIYDLTRSNVLVTDPANSTFQTQLGEVRSRGFELEAKTKIGYTNLNAAYAYTDARTIESSPLTPEEEGKQSVEVPYNQFSVWGDHSFGAFGLPGLKIGVGMRYVDSTRGKAMGQEVKVPSFTLFDAMASYTTGPWRFALNGTNLADKNYVASCTYACFYGQERRLTASATYAW